MHILVMGVSGSGKSTIGALLAHRLGVPFIDADDLHPPANRAKLWAGEPLADADRWPWLAAVRQAWHGQRAGVLACSALRLSYRQFLLDGLADARVVYLHADPGLIAQRLAARRGHFAAASLLASQVADLEPPADAIMADIEQAPAAVVDAVLGALGATGARARS